MFNKEIKEIEDIIEKKKQSQPISTKVIAKIILDNGPQIFCYNLKKFFTKQETKIIVNLIEERFGNLFGSKENLFSSIAFQYGMVDEVRYIIRFFKPWRFFFLNTLKFLFLFVIAYSLIRHVEFAIVGAFAFYMLYQIYQSHLILFRQNELLLQKAQKNGIENNK